MDCPAERTKAVANTLRVTQDIEEQIALLRRAPVIPCPPEQLRDTLAQTEACLAAMRAMSEASITDILAHCWKAIEMADLPTVKMICSTDQAGILPLLRSSHGCSILHHAISQDVVSYNVAAADQTAPGLSAPLEVIAFLCWRYPSLRLARNAAGLTALHLCLQTFSLESIMAMMCQPDGTPYSLVAAAAGDANTTADPLSHFYQLMVHLAPAMAPGGDGPREAPAPVAPPAQAPSVQVDPSLTNFSLLLTGLPPTDFILAPHPRTGRTAICEADAALRNIVLGRLWRPPLWVPDSQSSSCMVCSRGFTSVGRRRHHCRHCSRLVCNSCSSRSCAIPKFGSSTRLRVCDHCFPFASHSKTY
ncbi:hypothetical protein H696_00186 [Fonticula alba]|uniref:FYVE-type domain-containing protein n=1 Tax=Fonticula alba TaxID=691883 RepID=A0A058ZGI2_FONAL|nr:hypothetical protein H696_00186 [Fonticula alba]KCV72602.1 hypothetical protein H696_00186 [Fonticula alba]|eukprot:XP_009492303.1 hypothetical protein H696_00186 [Fonticula alba]